MSPKSYPLPFPVLTQCDSKSGLCLYPTKTQAMLPIMAVFLVTSFEMGRPTLKQNIWSKKTRRTAMNLGHTFLWQLTYKDKEERWLLFLTFFPLLFVRRSSSCCIFSWCYLLWDSNVYWRPTEVSTPWATELLGSWPFRQNTVIAGWNQP